MTELIICTLNLAVLYWMFVYQETYYIKETRYPGSTRLVTERKMFGICIHRSEKPASDSVWDSHD